MTQGVTGWEREGDGLRGLRVSKRRYRTRVTPTLTPAAHLLSTEAESRPYWEAGGLYLHSEGPGARDGREPRGGKG